MMVNIKMKKITISILDPSIKRILGGNVEVTIDDDGDFLDAIAKLDEHYWKKPFRAKRGEIEIVSILQFIWDARENKIFDDVGIESRDASNKWLPVKENPFMSLPNGTTLLVTPDAGC